MEKLHDIIRNAGLSTRPEYYSGRGAILSDLNSDILMKIKVGIEETYGKEPAMQFVTMVQRMSKMSATAFLQSLYGLFRNDWTIPTRSDESGIAIAKNEDGSYNELSGVMSIFGMMSGDNKRDDTPQIRNQFLRSCGVQIPGGRDEFGNHFRY